MMSTTIRSAQQPLAEPGALG